MMYIEIYKGCRIESTPYKLVDAGSFKYSVNGVIQINYESNTVHIMTESLGVPDNEWKHFSEDNADQTFVRYAKIYIENNIP